MKKIEKDIKRATDILNKCIKKERFMSIYPFSNENLIGTFNDYNFNNKKCLTVLASSDQALDMHLLGAKKITAFDVNPLTEYYFYLKKAALLSNLSKEEYINFFYPYSSFCAINKGSLNQKTFDKIVINLSDENLIFWSKIFNDFKPEKISETLFQPAINSINELPIMINYLNGTNYETLKEKITDMTLNFIHTNITELPELLKKNLDFIYLSNIMQYANEIYKIKSSTLRKQNIKAFKKYKELILELSENLNKDGNIIISYLFLASNLNCTPSSEIIKKIFNKKCFSFKTFKSNGINCEDNAIFVYTKTK